MFKAYRCRFCGDVYMGEGPPNHCPYCGAHAQYVVAAHDYSVSAPSDLSERSRANLVEAMALEVDNAAYYRAVAAGIPDQVWIGIFKYLARVEGEHAGTIRKTLGLAVLAEAAPVESPSDLGAALTEVRRRESRAEGFYQQALLEATEARVNEIFRCLIEIETDHLSLADEALVRLAGEGKR